MNKTKAIRAQRMLTAVLLIVMLSFTSVFAGTETKSASDSTQLTGTKTAQVSNIIKRGKYYYYKNPSTGKIRKKKGFVKDCGHLYYVKKGGRIITKKTFKVKKKKYRAYKNGVIATGLYKWKKKWNFSDPATGQWIKKEKIVKWNGNKYYVQKGGVVLMKAPFTYKNKPYKADASGKVTAVPIPDGGGNPVINVAKSQVGIMTGVTYWKWYFKSKFINTDATPWCGTFVAWCYNEAGYYDKITGVKKYGNLGYVPSYSSFADKKKKWVNRTGAKGGDIIIFGSSSHVGLVEGISDGYIITIEGNAGPTAAFGCGKAGAVVRRIYPMKSKRIKGVIRVM